MQTIPRILVNLLVILVKIPASSLVKLTELIGAGEYTRERLVPQISSNSEDMMRMRLLLGLLLGILLELPGILLGMLLDLLGFV